MVKEVVISLHKIVIKLNIVQNAIITKIELINLITISCIESPIVCKFPYLLPYISIIGNI